MTMMTTDRPNKRARLALALMAGATLAGCAAYEPCQTASCTADRAISAEVLRQFSYRDAFMPNTIRVQTYDGVVYLYGFVDTEYELALATDIARVPGVKEVRNELCEWPSRF
jgi:osmotically-inducible protein OsmY